MNRVRGKDVDEKMFSDSDRRSSTPSNRTAFLLLMAPVTSVGMLAAVACEATTLGSVVLTQLSTEAPFANARVSASKCRISPSVISAPEELLELDDEELLELDEELLELDDEELLELDDEELLELDEDELLEIGWGGRRVSGTPCQPPEASQPVSIAPELNNTRAQACFLTITQR